MRLPATYEQLHRAILTGLLGNIGAKSEDPGVYLGARGIKFAIFPGSPLKKKGPSWLMAAELTETTRLYARTVAAIDAQWLERAGAHLIKKTYHDPHWEKGGGQAYAFERVTLYGLVVVPRRRVAFGPVDPQAARSIFIREGLVHGQLTTHGAFLRHNQELRHDIEELEHKSRRHDVLVDEEQIFAFYDAIVPPEIWSAQQFERWRREVERSRPKLLFLTREQLMRHSGEEITEQRFPAGVEIGGVMYALTYKFEPGHALDGVTMSVPLHLLNQLDERRCEWLVPGLLRDKVSHLVRGLPKNLRRNFVPAPQYVTAVLEMLEPGEGPLLPALSEAIQRKTGIEVAVDAWDLGDLPPYLLMNFKVVDDRGHGARHGARSARAARAARREGATAVQRERAREVRAQGTHLVGLRRASRAGGVQPWWSHAGGLSSIAGRRRFGGPRRAGHRARRGGRPHAAGCAVCSSSPPSEQVKHLARSLPGFQEMNLRYALLLELEGGKQEKGAVSDRLRQELTDAICDRAFFVEDQPVRNAAAFQERVVKARTRSDGGRQRSVPGDERDPHPVPCPASAHQPAGRARLAARHDRHPQPAQGAAPARFRRHHAATPTQTLPALPPGHRVAPRQVQPEPGQGRAVDAADPGLVAGLPRSGAGRSPTRRARGRSSRNSAGCSKSCACRCGRSSSRRRIRYPSSGWRSTGPNCSSASSGRDGVWAACARARNPHTEARPVLNLPAGILPLPALNWLRRR